MITVALIAYIAATAVGMFAGSLMPFWSSVAPVVFTALLVSVAAFVAGDRRSRDFDGGYRADITARRVLCGGTWGALAGSFAASTCGATHARSLLGSEVSAVVMALVAIALVLVADMLPRAVASRPHALCGLLFLSTVGLALALGAEVPRG